MDNAILLKSEAFEHPSPTLRSENASQRCPKGRQFTWGSRTGLNTVATTVAKNATSKRESEEYTGDTRLRVGLVVSRYFRASDSINGPRG